MCIQAEFKRLFDKASLTFIHVRGLDENIRVSSMQSVFAPTAISKSFKAYNLREGCACTPDFLLINPLFIINMQFLVYHPFLQIATKANGKMSGSTQKYKKLLIFFRNGLVYIYGNKHSRGESE